MADCRKCQRTDIKCCFTCKKNSGKCNVLHHCGSDCSEHESRIKTNADKIRAMSDEELTEFLNTLFVEGQIEALHEQYPDSVFNRKESSLKWLQSESE